MPAARHNAQHGRRTWWIAAAPSWLGVWQACSTASTTLYENCDHISLAYADELWGVHLPLLSCTASHLTAQKHSKFLRQLSRMSPNTRRHHIPSRRACLAICPCNRSERKFSSCVPFYISVAICPGMVLHVDIHVPHAQPSKQTVSYILGLIGLSCGARGQTSDQGD